VASDHLLITSLNDRSLMPSTRETQRLLAPRFWLLAPAPASSIPLNSFTLPPILPAENEAGFNRS
jgi:hypothetical protein